MLSAACSDAPSSSNVLSPGPSSGPAQVALTASGGCGDAYLWAETSEGDTAVTVEVNARKRSNDKKTTIVFSVPDPAVKVRVLRGTNLSRNFCTDLPSTESDPDTNQPAVSGSGKVVLDPATPNLQGACGKTIGSAQIEGLVADDGTVFAPISIETNDIGCYSG